MVDFISSGIRLGQMCDLSRDVVAGLPVISMLGDCEVFIENYRGILEYSSEYLKVSTKIGNIRVSGSNLVIYHMNQDEILLRGRIGKVSLKERLMKGYIIILLLKYPDGSGKGSLICAAGAGLHYITASV